MAGASMGPAGANRVAGSSLSGNNPFASSGMRTGSFMEVPFRFWGRVLGAACVLSYAAVWANRRLFHTTPESMTPDFQEKARKHGPVAERSHAPPVFLNPIKLGIPGFIRGPDDVADA